MLISGYPCKGLPSLDSAIDRSIVSADTFLNIRRAIVQGESRCMVCGGTGRHSFSKEFAGLCGLDRVNYHCCDGCGFTWSDTHFRMSPVDWKAVNDFYHRRYFGSEHNADDPRWMERLREQQAFLLPLWREGIFDNSLEAMDYGCGDGKLADMLTASGLPTRKYDKYINHEKPDYLSDGDLQPGRFGLVINTSVFEHVLALETLDEIAACVNPRRGVLAVHTLVSEKVPRDPAWFYLLPVHVSFFSNRSMSLLMRRWHFEASLYDVEARMWLMFREEAVARRAFNVARTTGRDVYVSAGFADYWK